MFNNVLERMAKRSLFYGIDVTDGIVTGYTIVKGVKTDKITVALPEGAFAEVVKPAIFTRRTFNYSNAHLKGAELITDETLGHKYYAVVTEPDCVNGGYTTYTCSVCGDTYKDNYTDALGHKEVMNC